MSRTFRASKKRIDCNCGAPLEQINQKRYLSKRWYTLSEDPEWLKRQGLAPQRTCLCGVKYDYYSKRNLKRDRKPWGRPTKKFKTVEKRVRRAKEKHAFRIGKEIPIFKKTDKDEWYFDYY
jgi:hypothetical protein